jgi:glycosyltransferase involved in cell wall biosynthesis
LTSSTNHPSGGSTGAARVELTPNGNLDLSVVLPVYRCAECIRPLHGRLTETLQGLGLSYELIFVDDRSPDGAWQVLRDLNLVDPRVRAFRLSRNFGQQAAITAGIGASRGTWTVVMDCDLQDPPEVIADLYAKAQEGFDIVLGRRREKKHPFFRLVAARLYFKFLRLFLGVHISGEYGSFSIIAAKVREAFLRVPDRDRHYLPILLWLGFNRASVDYEHAERHAGGSSYSLRSLVKLAVEGVFFQTASLLRWIVYLGFCVALAGALLAIGLIVLALLVNPPPGWTSLAVLLLLVGGFIIVSTGVTGLYIGKIFQQVKNRPLFLIDEELGLTDRAQGVAGSEIPERTFTVK